MHITDYLKTHTQAQLADMMGVTKGAVWQMIRDKRDVVLRLNDRQELVEWVETKRKVPQKRRRTENTTSTTGGAEKCER